MRTMILALLIAGCSPDKEGFVVTGELADDYRGQARGLTPDLEPDTLAAIPHIRGFAGNWDAVVTTEITPGQDFELVLDPYSDHVLVLTDTLSAPEPQLVAVFEMPSEQNTSTLTDLAASRGDGQDVDMGEVRAASDQTAEAETAMETVADAFGLDEDQLQQLALTDDSYRGLASQYLNADPTTGDSWWAGLGYGFHQPLAQVTAPDPAAYAYLGPHVAFNTNVDAVVAMAEDLCAGTTSLHITPPGPVTLANGVQLSPDRPADNSGLTERTDHSCATPDGGLSIQWSSDMIWFNLSQSPVIENAPGWWSVAIDGEERADFALSLSNPINAQGQPTLPVPIPRLTLEGQRITGVGLDWYFAGTNGALQPMDPEVAEQLIYGSNFQLEGLDETGEVFERSEGRTGDQTPLAPDLPTLTHDWTLDGSGLQLIRVNINIAYAGQGATFEFSDL